MKQITVTAEQAHDIVKQLEPTNNWYLASVVIPTIDASLNGFVTTALTQFSARALHEFIDRVDVSDIFVSEFHSEPEYDLWVYTRAHPSLGLTTGLRIPLPNNFQMPVTS